MHQQILGIKGCDHIDGDTLNNCDYNLRPANHRQNAGNQRKQAGTTSRYKGVRLRRANGKWTAYITVNSRRIYLGEFKKEEDAARAYDSAALKYFGEFARLNFPENQPERELSESDRRDMEEVAAFRANPYPVTTREGPAKGEGHGMAKLNWPRVNLIRLDGALGMSQRSLAKRFNIDQTMAGLIPRWRNWKEAAQQWLESEKAGAKQSE